MKKVPMRLRILHQVHSELLGGVYRAELDAPHAVAQLVERRRPAHDAHHVRNDQQNAAGDTGLSRQPHLKRDGRSSL